MDPNELAERAVLVRLFQRFPDSFVWIGGSVLQLVHHSSRTSFDLDLAPTGEPPPVQDVASVISGALDECNSLVGGSFRLDQTEADGAFARFVIRENGRDAFTVDFVRMGGGSLSGTYTTLLSSPLGSATVVVPNDSTLLAQKVRTFLVRTYPKPGDLYDIWFLRDRGVRLSQTEREALADSLAFAEVDREEALGRLAKLARVTWLGALERAGVKGLTAATAATLLQAAREIIEEVLPG